MAIDPTPTALPLTHGRYANVHEYHRLIEGIYGLKIVNEFGSVHLTLRDSNLARNLFQLVAVHETEHGDVVSQVKSNSSEEKGDLALDGTDFALTLTKTNTGFAFHVYPNKKIPPNHKINIYAVVPQNFLTGLVIRCRHDITIGAEGSAPVTAQADNFSGAQLISTEGSITISGAEALNAFSKFFAQAPRSTTPPPLPLDKHRTKPPPPPYLGLFRVWELAVEKGSVDLQGLSADSIRVTTSRHGRVSVSHVTAMSVSIPPDSDATLQNLGEAPPPANMRSLLTREMHLRVPLNSTLPLNKREDLRVLRCNGCSEFAACADAMHKIEFTKRLNVLFE